MRESMLYDLYFGNLVPWDRGRAQDPNYPLLTHKICDIKEYFQKLLSPEEFEKLEEIGDLQAQINTIEEVDLFEYAFCMGILLMIDVFGFKKKRLTESESE